MLEEDINKLQEAIKSAEEIQLPESEISEARILLESLQRDEALVVHLDKLLEGVCVCVCVCGFFGVFHGGGGGEGETCAINGTRHAFIN